MAKYAKGKYQMSSLPLRDIREVETYVEDTDLKRLLLEQLIRSKETGYSFFTIPLNINEQI